MMDSTGTSAKVVWNTMMSLDGFVAGPEETMEWAFGFDSGSDSSSIRVVDRLGALLVGRRTMDVEDRNQPGFYGGSFSGPFFVLTSDRERPRPVVKGVTGTLVHDPIEVAVERALDAAEGRDVAVLGRTIARACLDADLLDEIVVFVAPVLLGSGVRLYEGIARRLDLTHTECDGEITTLTLTPRRP
jgi:dihydrofolate reductase